MLCAVPRSIVTLEQILSMVNAATGWKTTWFELLKSGERANNMARLFNLQEGHQAAMDSHPKILLSAIQGGRHTGKGAIHDGEFRHAVQLFYQMAGWDEQGVPLKGKLEELDIAEFLAL